MGRGLSNCRILAVALGGIFTSSHHDSGDELGLFSNSFYSFLLHFFI
ncbi:hypothetical protein DsansV1_C17g0148091 [Dioscorea sansibarensis]